MSRGFTTDPHSRNPDHFRGQRVNTSADRWGMHGTQASEHDELPASGRTIEIIGASFTTTTNRASS